MTRREFLIAAGCLAANVPIVSRATIQETRIKVAAIGLCWTSLAVVDALMNTVGSWLDRDRFEFEGLAAVPPTLANLHIEGRFGRVPNRMLRSNMDLAWMARDLAGVNCAYVLIDLLDRGTEEIDLPRIFVSALRHTGRATVIALRPRLADTPFHSRVKQVIDVCPDATFVEANGWWAQEPRPLASHDAENPMTDEADARFSAMCREQHDNMAAPLIKVVAKQGTAGFRPYRDSPARR